MTAPIASTAPTVVPSGGLGHQLRAAIVVWQRELIRFQKDRSRMVASFAQPLLFLFVLGKGLGSLMSDQTGDVELTTFLFPGVLATSVLFTAAFAGISMVWDREFGFLREMLVAPVSTTAVLLGKCAGGATVATIQSLVLMALAGVVGVPYDPLMMLELLGLLFLMAFLITALGLLLAARIKQVQSAMPLVQLIIMPLMFLSGALFPLSNLPGWLSILVHVNPMTYAVQPIRDAVFARLDVSAATQAALNPGISWGTWEVPPLAQIGVVVVSSFVLLGVAVLRFARTE